MTVTTALKKLRMSHEASRAALPALARTVVLLGCGAGLVFAWSAFQTTQSYGRAALIFLIWVIAALVPMVIVLDVVDRDSSWTGAQKALGGILLFLGVLALVNGAQYLTRLLTLS